MVVFLVVLGAVLERVRAARDLESESPRQADDRDRVSDRALDQLSDWLRSQVVRERDGRPVTAREILDGAAESARRELESDPAALARLQRTLGEVHSALSEYGPAEQLLREALEAQQELPGVDDVELSETLYALGAMELARGRFEEAERILLQAQAIREHALGREAPELAEVLNKLGVLYRNKGRYDDAEEVGMKALAIREKELGPSHPQVATVLYDLAALARRQGDFGRSESMFKRALEIRESSLGHDHKDVGTVCNGYAVLLKDLGDYPQAVVFYRRALQIWQRTLGETSPYVGGVLSNLAVVYWYQGRYAEAEPLLRRALDITENAYGELHPAVATTMTNLALVFSSQRRDDAAEPLLKRALAIRENRLGGEHRAVGQALVNLAGLYQRQMRFDEATPLLDRAAAVIEKALGSDHQDLAAVLVNAGRVRQELDDHDEARRLYLQALGIAERALGPQHPLVARYLEYLAALDRLEKRFEASEELYLRALAVLEPTPAANQDKASVLYGLARLYRETDRHELSVSFFSRSLEAVESQRLLVGGHQSVREAFDTKHTLYYRDYSALLVELGRVEEAFDILERSRAREYLAILSQRDLDLSARIPVELESRRRRTEKSYDRIFTALAELGEGEGARRRQRENELAGVRRDLERIRQEIREVSPEVADTRDPRPLPLNHIRRLLDPGVLMLSFSIGDDQSYVFAVGPGDDETSASPLLITAEIVRKQVRRLREVVHPASSPRAFQMMASSLSSSLMDPVADRIARAERIVIIPDGALYLLPFALLPDPNGIDSDRYLVEVAPLTFAASASVHAKLRQPSVENRDIAVAAFGDPSYARAAEKGGVSAVEAFTRGGLNLSPLPWSRVEVDSIQQLFPGGSYWLAEEATEERAKSLDTRYDVIHFACHGYVDDSFPLESGLALSTSSTENGDNGFLKAWEVLEQLKLDARLVTLSACQTAVGSDLAGEGLHGLTRVFHAAGARSVLASLWSVSDQSTADLMQAFYGRLREGMPIANALRDAQLELLRGATIGPPDGEAMPSSHPFHWAGFQLYGG